MVPQLLVGSLLETCRSAIGQVFFSTVPEVFEKLARPSFLAVSKVANSTTLSRRSMSCVGIFCMLKLKSKRFLPRPCACVITKTCWIQFVFTLFWRWSAVLTERLEPAQR